MESVKEGLVAIASEILEDVKREAEKLVHDAERAAEEILRRAKENAEKIRGQLIAEAKRQGELERRKILSQAEMEMRTRTLQVKEELVNEAFQRALTRLKEFTQTEGYHACLLKLIQEASERVNSKDLVVYVNPRDRRWLLNVGLDELCKRFNKRLKLADETISCLGGCIIRSPDGRLSYDNTLEKRLERLRDILRVQVARILFGEG